MGPENEELRELRSLIARLTDRVYQLEQTVGVTAPPADVPRVDTVAPAVTASVEPPISKVPIKPATPATVPSFATVGAQTRDTDSTDLESKIGSQWLNRIGALAVFVGAYFFLTYAYQNHWIGPSAIIAIGLLAGIGIVFWSERFRARGYKVFSLSLKGLGLSVLYLSLWAGFQVYTKTNPLNPHTSVPLIPAWLAFGGMALVTATSVILALAQSASILAAFALIGGFATPLLLSTGQNHELFLFSYVGVLDLGTLVLVAYRPWRRLLSGAFFGTFVLYTGWYLEYYREPEPLALTLTFATVFFAIFAVAPLFAKERSADSISKTLLVLPLVNASAYFLAVYALLEDVSKNAIAWVAVALAAVYIVLSREVRKRMVENAESSRLLTLLHIALAVGFLTAAIPIKLESYWITIGWLVESGVLLYVGYRGASRFLKVLSLGALALGLVRLVLFDDFNVTRLFLNPRFAIYLVSIAVVAFAVYLARTSEEQNDTEQSLAGAGVVLVNVLVLLALYLEARTYFWTALAGTTAQGHYDAHHYRNLSMARDLTYSGIGMIYGAVLMAVGFWKRSSFLRWQALILLAITVGKVFLFDTSQLEFGYRIISFIALGALLMGVSYIYQRDWLRLSGHSKNSKHRSSASA